MAKSDTSAIPRLCKYRSMEEGKAREHTLSILKTLELRYSPASKFNDPFDCNLDIALKTTADVEAMVEQAVERGRAAVAGAVSHVIRALSERLGQEDVKVPRPAVEESRSEPERRTPSKLTLTIRTQDASGRWRKVSAGRLHNKIQHKRMTEMYRILDKSFGVLCLSRHPDNIRLWSHYASNHSGLCLEFDAAAHPAAFPRLHEVVYQTPYPVIPPEFPDLLQALRDKATDTIAETLLNVADVLANDLSGDKKETTPETAAALGLARWFYVKSSAWNYEKEWRCLKWKPGPQPFPPEALTRIIAGCTNTDATLALVREAISGTAIRNVPLFKAVRKARKFGLDIVPAE